MAVFAPIPLPKPGEGLAEGSDWMHKLLMAPIERREKEASARHQQALADLESSPLKLELLKAQIDANRSLANQRNAGSGVGGFNMPTKATVTNNQKIIQSIDNTLPQIQALIEGEHPGQLIGKFLNPDSQANYEANIGKLTDTLVAALGLPKTNESLHLARQIVQEKPLESRESYKKRMQELLVDLQDRRQRAADVLGDANVMSSGNSGYSDSSNRPAVSDGMITLKNKKTGEVKTISKADYDSGNY